MKIKEKESIKKEKTYKLTEEELKQVIKSSYNLSRIHLTEYVWFCFNNYFYEMNIGGTCKFLQEIFGLLSNNKTIRNKNNLSYWDYRQKNFYCPWDLNNLDKLIKGDNND